MSEPKLAEQRLKPIPIPMGARWREFRMRHLPSVVFLLGICAVAFLWNKAGAAGQLAAVGEGVRASIIAPRYGVVQQLLVRPYQIVEKDAPIAVLLPTDPMAKIDLVQTELEIARVRLTPTLAENNAMDYERLRMELLRTRTELAAARVNLARADSDVRRTAPLLAEKLISEDAYELSTTMRDLYRTEITNKSNVLAEMERRLDQLKLFGLPEPSQTNELKHIIANKLEAAYLEAATNWNPLTVRAPFSGMIQFINKQPGEIAVEGELLVTLNSLWAERVIGYLRQPHYIEPVVGGKVTVTTRARQRKQIAGEVAQIGAHYEPITNTLAFVRQGALVDVGLPIIVPVQPASQIRAGEVVDLHFETARSIETVWDKVAALFKNEPNTGRTRQ